MPDLLEHANPPSIPSLPCVVTTDLDLDLKKVSQVSSLRAAEVSEFHEKKRPKHLYMSSHLADDGVSAFSSAQRHAHITWRKAAKNWFLLGHLKLENYLHFGVLHEKSDPTFLFKTDFCT